ncbi:ABC transporter substrate-binding protein [Luteitalea sp.]|uniref:ABC transporter substrate-binding protein n=1 Tax=Luteitalea sp. TaxID=2004800 RepID=UPI0025B84851|nr:ABC transporter substrate-binding protein [Luteitalea sp.]
MLLRLLLVLSLVPVVACGSSSAPASDGSVTVTVAHLPNLTNATALVAVADGRLRTALAPHTLDVTPFSAGPQLIEALLAGEVDIAYVGPSPALNGFVKSRGAALRVIAGASSGGSLFVVRPEAGIRTPADLAGKRIATPQRGGTQDIALRFLVKGAGLRTSDEGGTVAVVPMQPADILTVFQRGQIDGAWTAEPWCTRLMQEAGATVWFDERTRWPEGRFATTHVIVATPFLERHPDIVRAFLRAHVEATQFVVDHPADAQRVVNAEIKRITTAALPARVLETAFRHVDFTWDPLADTVAVMADHAHQLGFLGDAAPDLQQLYALDPLNDVLREKGLPPIGAGGPR